MDDRSQAEAIVNVASGALSTDEKSLLIGIPALQVPALPVGTSVSVPEIALFKTAQDKGVAKFVATGYDAKTGKLIATTDPQYGFSHQTNHTMLLFFSWAERAIWCRRTWIRIRCRCSNIAQRHSRRVRLYGKY